MKFSTDLTWVLEVARLYCMCPTTSLATVSNPSDNLSSGQLLELVPRDEVMVPVVTMKIVWLQL